MGPEKVEVQSIDFPKLAEESARFRSPFRRDPRSAFRCEADQHSGLKANVFHRPWYGAALDNHPARLLRGKLRHRVPARRLSMRKSTEVLRLRYELGLGQRQIAASCSIAQATVADYPEAGRDR